MAERATARPSTVPTPRNSNRRRTTSGVPSSATGNVSAPRVRIRAVLRRMLTRAMERRAATAETAPRANRRRVSAPSPVKLSERVSGWRTHLERPLAVAKRAGVIASRVVMMAAVIAAVVAGGRLIEAHVRKSAAFATKVIELRGQTRLEQAAVLSAAGLAIGKNVFDVSPEEAENALRKHPWIAAAQVTRRLPDSYFVEIEERQAVAILTLPEPYLVAGDASVFKRWEPGDPDELPLITGADAVTFANDRVYRTTLLVSAVALLHDYRDAGLWRRAPIQEIHVEADEGLTLYVGDDATAVKLDRAPFRKKLSRLRRVLDQLESKHVEPAYVYLDNVHRQDRVTVRLR